MLQVSNYEFAKTTVYYLTSGHCTNTTGPHIHQLIRTLLHHIPSYSYAYTTVCNLTGYLIRTPIKDKKTMTVATHLFSDIMLKFNFPRILHSDNGREFKSKLIEHLCQQLCIKKTYISPYHTQADRKLESSHRFIKDCI